MRMPWTPQDDVDQSFEYSDPVQQNRSILNGLRNNRTTVGMNPQWDDYQDLLAAKGVSGFGALEPTERLPAGIASLQGLQQALSGGGLSELLEQSEASRTQGAQVRRKSGGRVGPNETGRF